jgi:DTW domain-containing protein YfiP
LCICALIPRLDTRTKLLLVIHRFEDRKPTNTGRLAAECLVQSRVIVRGKEGEPPCSLDLDPATQPVLLYPHEDAIALGEFVTSRPLTLIVPDGTWRQAWKLRHRVPQLAEVPCVSLPAGPASLYRLRAEPQEGGLSTIEAVARAMGILEGPEVQQAIERVFTALVERTLWSRGSVDAAQVSVGIPEGVMRHEPRSGVR